MDQTKLDKLAAVLQEAPDEIFIQPHNVPDPDAISSKKTGIRRILPPPAWRRSP
ncbi:MAG: hypothetical protein LBO80_09955 [Treponema sp.]|jgi:nanoRNase/pAp phosphatase (c-di-AMP/oligoRNAs hydrolase)|nr:hypothetical protein [Treponema sp.]